MYSMTGFGRGEFKSDGLELSVEIKSVNNRYLDVSVKCPRIFSAFEDLIRGIVRQKLTRGHADVYVSLYDKREREKTVRLDESAAKVYVEAAKKILGNFPEIKDDLSVTDVLRAPDVLKYEDSSAADEEILSALKTALGDALDKLNAMRLTEGEKLRRDMLDRVKVIENYVNEIGVRAPSVVENYKSKLEVRMKKLLEGVEPDESRFLTEVAVFADRSNIDEEITRLYSHISQFRSICREALVGRQLDFLIQEFNREANTVCSKSNDLEITRLGLALKNEIEKIREQVQNIE